MNAFQGKYIKTEYTFMYNLFFCYPILIKNRGTYVKQDIQTNKCIYLHRKTY